MKKETLLCLYFICLFTDAYSQRFYLKGGAGYFLPFSSQTLGVNGTPYNGTFENNSYSIKRASFSSGIAINSSVGCLFTKNIGIELGVNYTASSTAYKYERNDPTSSNYYIQITQKAKSPLFLMPAIMLQTQKEGLNAFCRLGMVLPVITRVSYNELRMSSYKVYNFTSTFNAEIKNNFTVGFSIGGGLKYKVSPHLNLYAEFDFISLAPYVKEVKSGSQKTRYSKLSNTYLSNQQYVAPTYSLPFSSAGGHIGMWFNLGRSKEIKPQ